ncbi:hypothetical protein Trydic_g19663 [Trypoxylus dichotomus]
MKKILSGNRKKKRLYLEEPILPTSSTFARDLFKRPTPENTRRLSVLNKRFMMNITDLMVSGENAAKFAGYGLEINRVKVTPDYKGINVYWIAKGNTNDEEIDKLLQSRSGPLRHELTQLHVIGMVPKIKFIKDKEYARMVEVDSKLAYADFGEDHEQSDATIKYKSYLELTKSLDPELKERILLLEESTKNEIGTEDIPEMPQNVLGLNHADIMERIKKMMRKSNASHRNHVYTEEEIMSHASNPHPFVYKNAKEQREAFQQFLAERQILRNKARKCDKNYRPDWDYIEEESELLKQQQIDLIKLNDLDDRDFIEEDYEFDRNDEGSK